MILKLKRGDLENLYSEMGDDDLLVINTNEESGKELSLEKTIKSYITLPSIKDSWIDKFAEDIVTSKPESLTSKELNALKVAQTIIDLEPYYRGKSLITCSRGKKIHALVKTDVNLGRESDDYLVSLFDKAVKEGLLTND